MKALTHEQCQDVSGGSGPCGSDVQINLSIPDHIMHEFFSNASEVVTGSLTEADFFNFLATRMVEVAPLDESLTITNITIPVNGQEHCH